MTKVINGPSSSKPSRGVVEIWGANRPPQWTGRPPNYPQTKQNHTQRTKLELYKVTDNHIERILEVFFGYTRPRAVPSVNLVYNNGNPCT